MFALQLYCYFKLLQNRNTRGRTKEYVLTQNLKFRGNRTTTKTRKGHLKPAKHSSEENFFFETTAGNKLENIAIGEKSKLLSPFPKINFNCDLHCHF